MEAFRELRASRWAELAAAILYQRCRLFFEDGDPRALIAALVAGFVAQASELSGEQVARWVSEAESDGEDKVSRGLLVITASLINVDKSGLTESATQEFTEKVFSTLERGEFPAFVGMLALATVSESLTWVPTHLQMQKLLAIASERSRNGLVTGLAGYVLGQHRFSAAVPLLISMLENPLVIVRQLLVEGLGHVGDACAAEPLLRRLDDPNDQVRKEAVRALAKLRYEHPFDVVGRERSVDGLIRCLDDSDASIRRASAEALGKMRYARAAEALAARSRDEREDESVRRQAAEALNQIEGAAASG
jgi:hypothetical protein